MKARNVAFSTFNWIYSRENLFIFRSILSCTYVTWLGGFWKQEEAKSNVSRLQMNCPNCTKNCKNCKPLEIFRDSTNNEGGQNKGPFLKKWRYSSSFVTLQDEYVPPKPLPDWTHTRIKEMSSWQTFQPKFAQMQWNATRKNFVVFARLISLLNLKASMKKKKVSEKRNSNRKIDENSNLSDL